MRIGVWGDSITYGSHDSEALGWVGRLRKNLIQRDPRAQVYNFGISGDTSSNVLKRFEIEAAASEPSTVIFAVGINDSKQNIQGENLVPIDEYSSNLDKLICAAKSVCSGVLIIGATSVEESICNRGEYYFRNSEIEKYNLAALKIAQGHNLRFVDMFSILESSCLADGLHPNAKGYQRMYERVLETVQNI